MRLLPLLFLFLSACATHQSSGDHHHHSDCCCHSRPARDAEVAAAFMILDLALLANGKPLTRYDYSSRCR